MLPMMLNDTEKNASKENNIPLRYYAQFGDLAETIRGQGWRPERWNSEYTEYRPSYGLLNSVELNDGKGTKGYFGIKGGKNGNFDLYIKKPDGSIDRTLLSGVNAQQVNDYFTNYTAQDNYGNQLGSVVNQRANDIQSGKATMPVMSGMSSMVINR